MIIDIGPGEYIRPLHLGDQHWLHRKLQDKELAHWLLGVPDPYFPEHAYRYVVGSDQLSLAIGSAAVNGEQV